MAPHHTGGPLLRNCLQVIDKTRLEKWLSGRFRLAEIRQFLSRMDPHNAGGLLLGQQRGARPRSRVLGDEALASFAGRRRTLGRFLGTNHRGPLFRQIPQTTKPEVPVSSAYFGGVRRHSAHEPAAVDVDRLSIHIPVSGKHDSDFRDLAR
jgi:hypothetical protein